MEYEEEYQINRSLKNNIKNENIKFIGNREKPIIMNEKEKYFLN